MDMRRQPETPAVDKTVGGLSTKGRESLVAYLFILPDALGLAILAALNIADECFRLRRQVREADEKAAKRAEGLVRELTAVLGE